MCPTVPQFRHVLTLPSVDFNGVQAECDIFSDFHFCHFPQQKACWRSRLHCLVFHNLHSTCLVDLAFALSVLALVFFFRPSNSYRSQSNIKLHFRQRLQASVLAALLLALNAPAQLPVARLPKSRVSHCQMQDDVAEILISPAQMLLGTSSSLLASQRAISQPSVSKRAVTSAANENEAFRT